MIVEAVNRRTNDFDDRQMLTPDKANPGKIQFTVSLSMVYLTDKYVMAGNRFAGL